jgi:hypothetical protein
LRDQDVRVELLHLQRPRALALEVVFVMELHPLPVQTVQTVVYIFYVGFVVD